MLKHMST